MVQLYDDEATALVGFCFPGIPILTLRHRLQTMAGTRRPSETVLFIRFRSHRFSSMDAIHIVTFLHRSYSRFSRTLACMHTLIRTFSHHSPLNSLARTYGRTHTCTHFIQILDLDLVILIWTFLQPRTHALHLEVYRYPHLLC